MPICFRLAVFARGHGVSPRRDEMTYLRPGSLSVFVNTGMWFSIPETVPHWRGEGGFVAVVTTVRDFEALHDLIITIKKL